MKIDRKSIKDAHILENSIPAAIWQSIVESKLESSRKITLWSRIKSNIIKWKKVMNKTLLTAVAALTFLSMGRGVCADDFALKRDEAFNNSLSQAIKKGMDPLVAREIKKEHTESMRKIDDEYYRGMQMEALREEMRLLRHEIEDLDDFNMLKLR